MKWTTWTFSALTAVAVCLTTTTADAALIVGVTSTNDIIEFDSGDPTDLLSSLPISGLLSNEVIRGIDFRPTDGLLYALGSFSRLYTLNRLTGAATLEAVLSTSVNGANFGFDFNPAADFASVANPLTTNSLRIVSNSDRNYAVNADTGAVFTATPVFYSGPNPPNPNIVGVAYTNSVTGGISGGNSGPPGTQQYVIDSGTDGLVLQNFNAGTLTPVGPLGFNTTANVGFDILARGINNNIAFATLELGTQRSDLYRINLFTGQATNLGQIDGGILVPNIAIVPVPEPGTIAMVLLGIIGFAGCGRNRRS